jgi:hypothetical protein
MFRRVRIREACAVVILLLLVLPFYTFAKKDKSKKEKAIPRGTPVLWLEPTDIGSRNLYLGAGGESMEPDLKRVTLIKKEPGGYSTKYRVRDASGREWVAKIGKEAQSETAAVRLLWAVGYFSDVDYLVPSVRIEGLNKTFQNVRFGARPKDVERISGWKWDDNPFVGRREFQGLKVMMALLNNWDIKDSNNTILVVRNENGKNDLRYVVHDLGGTFGKISHIPRFLQFKPDRNNPKAYAKSHLVDKVKDGRVRFHYSTKRSSLFKDITVDDARWIAGWLSRLSGQQIEDAFRAAHYNPDQVRMLVRGVRKRIDELVKLAANSQIAKRTKRGRVDKESLLREHRRKPAWVSIAPKQ